MKSDVITTCPCCAGTGKTTLPEPLFRTLERVRAAGGGITVERLTEPELTPNAINNRLAKLEGLGLVRRMGKLGRLILWEAA